MRALDRRAVFAVLLATTAMATPALAQDASTTVQPDRASADQDTSNDIIVTAQKREESLQNVPISIQAFSTKKLDDLNITNFNEYAALLPSVAFQSAGPGETIIYMRGVASGGDGNHSASLPSVGVYLDEQPVTTIGGNLDVHVYDIARIESLSGPQGTLYGASSEAGTIRIITNKPDTSSLYGRIDGEVNTVARGNQGGKVEGMLNVPVTANVAARVIGFWQRDAGYIDNVFGTRDFIPPDPPSPVFSGHIDNAGLVKKNYNDVETWGGRAALKIDLDSDWTVTPTALYQENRVHGFNGFDASVGDLKVQQFQPENRRDRFYQAALTIEGKIGDWDVTYAGAYMDRKDRDVSDYTDYAEAYDTYYAAYGGVANYQNFRDTAGNVINSQQHIVGTDHFRKLSQEFRVTSPSTDRFRVVAGGFYQRQSNRIHQDYQVTGLAPSLSVDGFPGTLWLTQQFRVDKDYAMFGEASYDILPNLTLTAGGRAFIYDNSLIGFFGFGSTNPVSGSSGVNRCFATDGLRIRGYAGEQSSQTGVLLPPVYGGTPCTNLGTAIGGNVEPVDAQGSGFTHRLNLTWKPTSDALLYATWSRGFRPGGINRRADVRAYDPDYLTNYELGWKLTFLNGGLRFNGAVFQQNWDSFQFSYLSTNSFTIVVNGPDARIRGIEMDAAFNRGGLALTAAGAYTTSKTKQNLCKFPDPSFACTLPSNDLPPKPNAVLAATGAELPITPKFKVNGTARYTAPVGSGGTKAYGQLVIAHQSSARSDLRDADAALLGRLRAYTTGDLALGLTFERFNVEAFAQNLWDERAELSKFVRCSVCTRVYTLANTPRTLGIRAGAKF